MKFKMPVSLLVLLFFFFLAPLSASIVKINGKYCDDRYAPTRPLHEHFDMGVQHMEKEEWKEALDHLLIIAIHFPESPFYTDALFHSGACYFFNNDLELANKQFSLYLNQKTKLKYFEEVFLYKYKIAEGFRTGLKKRPFSLAPLPKVMSAKSDAIVIYDEVITALPHSEVAAQALYGKAALLRAQRKYKEGIEALTVLTKRFPNHPKAIDAYLLISDIYLDASKSDAQNPDLLALAKIQMQHFQQQFPGEDNLVQTEKNLIAMEEVFAKSLYDTGRFYERKKKPQAAKIYYEEAQKNYPNTVAARRSNERMAQLK